MDQTETEVGRLKRWLERDQGVIKSPRRENMLLRGEVEHFKAERNKMDGRYDNLMNSLQPRIEVTWPWVFGDLDERDVHRTRELLAAGVIPDLELLRTREPDPT